jgi:hypothetical protein
MVAQTRNLEHSRLFRHGDDHSGSLIRIELLAAALVAWAASSGALSLAAGISKESTMTSALPASGVGVRSGSSMASTRGSSFAARW